MPLWCCWFIFNNRGKLNFPGLYSVGKRLFFAWQCYEDFFFLPTLDLSCEKVIQHYKRGSNNKLLPPQAWHLADQKKGKDKSTKKTRKVKNTTVSCLSVGPVLAEGVLVRSRGHSSGIITALSEQSAHWSFSKCQHWREGRHSLIFLCFESYSPKLWYTLALIHFLK